MDEPEHKIVEQMAGSWDEHGHRPPRDWRVICSCGWQKRMLRDQIAATDAWRAHRVAAEVTNA